MVIFAKKTILQLTVQPAVDVLCPRTKRSVQNMICSDFAGVFSCFIAVAMAVAMVAILISVYLMT